MLRDMAHAQGELTIYLQIPASEEQQLRAVCQAIGYWGHTDSFASCVALSQSDPDAGECILLLRQLALAGRLQPYFSGLATEFRDQRLSWEEVTTARRGRGRKSGHQALVLDLYVWPLVLLRHSDGHKLFGRQSLQEALR